jgi:hypothetical protein
VTANVQTTNKPTVALVEYSGSKNNDCAVDAAYINNAGSAALFSGGPTRGIAKDRNYYLNGGTGLIRETYPVDEAGANLSAGGRGSCTTRRSLSPGRVSTSAVPRHDALTRG